MRKLAPILSVAAIVMLSWEIASAVGPTPVQPGPMAPPAGSVGTIQLAAASVTSPKLATPSGADAGSCGSATQSCVVTENGGGQILAMSSVAIDVPGGDIACPAGQVPVGIDGGVSQCAYPSTMKGAPILIDSLDAGGVTIWNGPDIPVLSSGVSIVNESVAASGISVSDRSGNGIDQNTDGGWTVESEAANITTSGLDGGNLQIRAEGAPNANLCLESGAICTSRAGQNIDLNAATGAYITSGSSGINESSTGAYSMAAAGGTLYDNAGIGIVSVSDGGVSTIRSLSAGSVAGQVVTSPVFGILVSAPLVTGGIVITTAGDGGIQSISNGGGPIKMLETNGAGITIVDLDAGSVVIGVDGGEVDIQYNGITIESVTGLGTSFPNAGYPTAFGTANSSTGSFSFYNASNNNILTFSTGATSTANLGFTWPTADAVSSGQPLQSNGSGAWSFAALNLAGAGVVTGILPAANGGVTSGSLQAIWSPDSISGTPLGDNVNFARPFASVAFAGKARKIACSWAVAGVGAGNVQMSIVDTSGPSTLCSCSYASACTVSINTNEVCDCNSGAMTAGHVYVMQFGSGTTCTVSNPATIECSVELTTP